MTSPLQNWTPESGFTVCFCLLLMNHIRYLHLFWLKNITLRVLWAICISVICPVVWTLMETFRNVLTFLLLRWMSPMLLARELGPRRVEVLWGQSTVTSVCSPISTFRTFSAPVTRIRGRPRRWVLNTLPYFCLRDAWKFEPYKKKKKDVFNSQKFPNNSRN